MKLLPCWEERLRKIEPVEKTDPITYSLRKSVTYYAGKANFVSSEQEAREMAEFAQQQPISHVGIDTEFRYDRPGVVIDEKRTAQDPTSIHPIILSIALAVPQGSERGNIYSFVIDLRKPELIHEIEPILRLPVCFCGHYLKVEFFCLWRLNLPEPRILWDTWVNEKALNLGRNHVKYKQKIGADDAELAAVKAEAEEDDTFSNSLVASCHRYGITYAMEGDKEHLQKSFLSHTDDTPFTEEQIRYAGEDAIAVARLYPLQVLHATQAGILHHLTTIEMPWVRTNARMEWTGMRIDLSKRNAILESLSKCECMSEQRLAALGVSNSQSHKQLEDFFQKEGILHAFRQKGKTSFNKKQLKILRHLHPAIELIATDRRILDLQGDKIMLVELIGSDGRMHPEHHQLGTHTGRQTSRWPNILGLDRMLRPLIVPDPGRGIGEVDWSQVEVGISGAIYNDSNLIAMFNSGDVYSGMAQHFFRGELTDEDQRLPSQGFKQKFPGLRNQMKSCTLGIIYGITPSGLAQSLNTTLLKAKDLQERFMSMFPALRIALAQTSAYGTIRGYASTSTGLRRYRAHQKNPSQWEKYWLTNHPVQGSAAAVFKATGNRLDHLYRRHNAHLVIPLHDAFVFEAPLEALSEVATLTETVMCQTIQEFFPVLHARVEVNIQHPECWNKDGDIEPLARWINEFSLHHQSPSPQKEAVGGERNSSLMKS